MISLNALYGFIENLIENATVGSPLHNSISFRNLRGSVDENRKIIRCDCQVGRFANSPDTQCQEINVGFTVQFWVTPEDGELASIDAAKDESFAMAHEFYKKLTSGTGPTLGGQVDNCYGDDFETGEANLMTQGRGVTFFDGVINPTS